MITCDRCNKKIEKLHELRPYAESLLYGKNAIFCERCYEELTATKLSASSNQIELISELLFGEKFASFEMIYREIIKLRDNEKQTEESISSCGQISDDNFIKWFKTNCQGYTDIERDIAYAAWKEGKKYS